MLDSVHCTMHDTGHLQHKLLNSSYPSLVHESIIGGCVLIEVVLPLVQRVGGQVDAHADETSDPGLYCQENIIIIFIFYFII
jgi:hypothetical protein